MRKKTSEHASVGNSLKQLPLRLRYFRLDKDENEVGKVESLLCAKASLIVDEP